jgi:hypothetical protein
MSLPTHPDLKTFIIEDCRPLLGWTRQKVRNQALMQAVVAGNLPAIDLALQKGAEIDAKSKLLVKWDGKDTFFRDTPLGFALDYGLTEPALFLLDSGASFVNHDIPKTLFHHGKDGHFLRAVGAKLVEKGWPVFEQGGGGDADFTAYDNLTIELLRENNPGLVEYWEALRDVMLEKSQLGQAIPAEHTDIVIERKMRL